MSKRAFYNRYSERERIGLLFTKPSLTQQSLYEDVNIHSIVNRGMNRLPANTSKPLYGVNLSDYSGGMQQYLQSSADVKNTFEALPDTIKSRFLTPEALYEFVKDRDKNFDEGVKLGLFSPSKPNVFEQSIEKIANFFDSQQKTAESAVIPDDQSSANNLGRSAS